MKKLLKSVAILLVVLSLFTLAGCGSKEESVTFKQETGEIEMVMTFDAKNDKVNHIHQESTIYLSSYVESQKEAFKEQAGTYEEKFANIEGVTYDMQIDGDNIIEIIDIQLNDENLQELISQNLLPVTNSNIDYISLQKTIEQFESTGWEKVK